MGNLWAQKKKPPKITMGNLWESLFFAYPIKIRVWQSYNFGFAYKTNVKSINPVWCILILSVKVKGKQLNR